MDDGNSREGLFSLDRFCAHLLLPSSSSPHHPHISYSSRNNTFHSQTTSKQATMATYTRSEAEFVPNHYVVVFKRDTPESVCETHCAWAHQQHSERVYPSSDEAAKYAGIKHTYKLSNGFAGYAGSFDDDLVKQFEATDEVWVCVTCGCDDANVCVGVGRLRRAGL